MAEIEITERHQYWLDHIKAADGSESARVEHARTYKLKVKVLYQ